MTRILLASPRRDDLRAFADALAASASADIAFAATGAEALGEVSRQRPDLVVVDDRLDDMSGLDLIRKILAVDAFVQTAAMSDLTDGEFHHRSEGLGIWKRLPILPGPAEAAALLSGLDGGASLT